ncbi:uncharacterized protein LOC111345455 [Stylophora pistillata]|uniref:uncharacterized protein LOC111345455 n=1 Tax=Stylophora pistillata TaxID=50429 RepID=UPI000C054BC2|nr:uncharacterized protein LOC111345455 [Stylophora pistillata]
MSRFNLKLCFRKAFLAVFLPLATGACVDLDLGVGSGTIPDSDITASSNQSINTPAKNGRLNYTSGSSWCAGTSDLNPYLQIDLQTPHIICAVSTQGNSQADQWVKSYRLQISTNGTTWTDFKEDGQVKFLRGNEDRNSEVKHVVYGVLTRYLRFLPQKHQGGVCMRTEVFGVEQNPTCEMEAIGLAFNGKIPNNSFTATSSFDGRYEPHDGRLNANGRGWGPLDRNDPKDYLQIDLLFEYVICAVATQGSKGSNEWTTKYKIYLSLDGKNFVAYNETGVEKDFTGNTDRDTIKKNSLQEFASSKFIRFWPTAYHNWKVLRVEVYGVLLTKVPSQPPAAFNLTASSSTSIKASWQLPPIFARHGRDITGFKLFYREKCFAGCFSFLNITSGSTFSRLVTGLKKYTEYEFQVLAYTSDGDGPKSPVEVERTQGDDCVQYDLGMEGGNIQHSRITASSSSTSTANGRLNYALGASWCAETNDTSPYLQIDLQTLHIICAVSTQGNSQEDQWVKNYTLQISTNGTSWIDYKEGGQVKFLRGNDDRNSEVKHVVYGVLTRYLRFLPQIHQGGVCMRTEVFGVDQKPTCEMEAIGLAFDGKIPNNSFTATSSFDGRYEPHDGRLNANGRGWGPLDRNDPKDYLQIDLLFEYVICAVATQGSKGTNEWTTKYKIYLSLDGKNFVAYNETGVEKVFTGNANRNTIKKNSLQEFASTKFIRFWPTAYHNWKVLRVEVYGVLLTKVPIQPPTAFNLTANSSTSITASWQLPPIFTRPGRHVTGFKLFYKKKDCGGSFSFLNITSGSTLSRLVTGLEKYTEYIFQLLAYTSKGDGLKSSVEVERTMEDAPSRPPSNFYVTATSSTTVTASWQLPPVDSRNGIIKGFKVFYKRKDSAGSGIILTINGESTFNKNVTGLNKYTEYEFQVLAFTSVGDGPNSSVVVKRTGEDVPSRPPGGFTLTATSSTSITASWQLPPEDFRNGNITGYKLFYKKGGSSGPASMQPINNQATRTQEVTGLDKFTEYEFQILAFTSVGDGQNSTVSFKKTKEAAPSGSPSQFNVTVNSSTSITASWHLPPESFRHGIIRGYKLFFKKKDSGSTTSLTINNATSKRVTNLDEYTDYEFQVLAFTSAGDGPKSPTVSTKTMEDAPSAPTFLSFVNVPPNNLHGPRATLSWSKPAEPNGVIRSYTLFYSYGGAVPKENSGLDKDALSHTVDVLGGVTYQFHVRALTIKPGPNGTINVTTKEYAPSAGPEPASPSPVNKTTFNISWEPLPREKSYGKVTLYEVKAIFLKKENSRKRSVINSLSANTSATFVVLSDFELCSKYNVSVRAYTAAGSGPYGEPSELKTSRPQPPGDFRATHSGTTQVTLTWKQYDGEGNIEYTLKYTGTKDYDKAFKDGEKIVKPIQKSTQTVTGLNPGTKYVFEVYWTSVCGKSVFKTLSVETDMMAPEPPDPHNVTDVEISETAVDIFLWPVEQKYGPISAYQVIVLKVVDGVEKLPENYDSQLKAASEAKKDDVNFYIAAEIKNVPAVEKPWKFTVGDGEKTEIYVNEELEKGQNYIVYERALTDTTKEVLKGEVEKVAKITITPTNTGAGTTEKSSGFNAVAVAVPVVLLLLLVPAVVVAVFFYRRRRQSRSKGASERSVRLGDLKNDDENLTASTSDLVYQNIGDIRQSIKGTLL